MESTNEGFDDMFSQMQLQNEEKKVDTKILDQLAGEETVDSSNSESERTTSVKGGKLNEYNIYHNIGEGAFGQVNLAKEISTGRNVAIKAVNIQRICQLNKERHILREKELLANLKHFNIIQLFATFKDEKNLYFVFEHGPKGTLDDIIKKTSGMHEQVIKVMFAQLINCLEFIMSKGIMHRDLKPQNIMLDDYYNMKMIDFGDAREVDELNLDDEGAGQFGGRKDTFVGTVNYQSPEVIEGEDQGHPLDIWALGCILFKMFINKVPFPGTQPMKVYADIKSRNITWPDEEIVKSRMSLEAQDLINRMIQVSPKNRLGHDLQSMKILKTHPFFQGVDFEAIQKQDYKGLVDLVNLYHPRVSQVEPSGRPTMSEELNTVVQPNHVVVKGNLAKKNWYGNKQVRYFELHSDGELKYYKDVTEFKGVIQIGPATKIQKEGKSSILINCEKKQKTYTIMQPDSSQINYQQDKDKGYTFVIDKWFKEITKVRDDLIQRERSGSLPKSLTGKKGSMKQKRSVA